MRIWSPLPVSARACKQSGRHRAWAEPLGLWRCTGCLDGLHPTVGDCLDPLRSGPGQLWRCGAHWRVARFEGGGGGGSRTGGMGMARNACTDAPRMAIMAAATCFVLLLPSALGQGRHWRCRIHRSIAVRQPGACHDSLPISIRRRAGLCWLALFLTLLLACRSWQRCSPVRCCRCWTLSTVPARWSSVAGMWCCRYWRRKSCHLGGSTKTHSWLAMARLKPSQGRFSPSQPTSAPQ